MPCEESDQTTVGVEPTSTAVSDSWPTPGGADWTENRTLRTASARAVPSRPGTNASVPENGTPAGVSVIVASSDVGTSAAENGWKPGAVTVTSTRGCTRGSTIVLPGLVLSSGQAPPSVQMVNRPVPAFGSGFGTAGGVIAWADWRTGVSPANPVVPVTVTVALSTGVCWPAIELGDDRAGRPWRRAA